MTSSLAKLLRQSISNEDELITIGQEVSYTKSYLIIQSMRYRDKLEFEIDMEEHILAYRIIKLVLQPLVENAIYHGIKYKEDMGVLRIIGYRQEDTVVLQVIDNGIGMDEKTMEHIFEKKEDRKSNGVGVYNVQNRLQLYYGSNYGISYESAVQKGTVASIIIPYKGEDNNEKV